MRTILVASVVALLMTGTAGATASPTGDPAVPNPRTSFVIVSLIPGMSTGTSNSSEPRPALSMAKLFLADYVLRHGDGSVADRELAQRAIRLSDNDAATTLDDKYPAAIAAIAAEFGLTDTRRGAFWGESVTSASDVADFLAAVERGTPFSPLLAWMAGASPIAADGTVQNWGTARIPAVIGSKWGWADDHVSEVASASFGPGFATAAFTYGDADDENADLAAFLGW
ncbi:hypothetical protein AB0L57_23855 [Nocardia sp. NPDC052254]|uniref:hypothetical protein n=1 Tax=Nocardia sp. NPDC052254 TaxID=3155681 RepID=UPI00342D51B8